jgi:hypothetical protein
VTRDQLSKRVEQVLASVHQIVEPEHAVNAALTVMLAAYGESSQQVKTLQTRWTEISKGPYAVKRDNTLSAVRGVLYNLSEEIKAGLLSSIERTVTADVLSDIVQLAHAALGTSGDGSKNVAAVLTAAAYEDTLRRLAKEYSGVIGQDKLESVIGKLKDAKVLVPPQLGVVQGYLSFRNHALHAEWEKIDRGTVISALSLIEELLLKQFGS